MALNKLKKWIGTQAMTAFFDQLNDNVDATNAAIDAVETHLADNAIDAHGTIPLCEVQNSSLVSVPSSTETVLFFNTKNVDTDNIHNPLANSNRLTCKTSGKYLIYANVGFLGNTIGYRHAMIKKNNTITVAFNWVSGSNEGNTLTLVTMQDMNINDHVSVSVKHNNSGALTINNTYNTIFGMVKVG